MKDRLSLFSGDSSSSPPPPPPVVIGAKKSGSKRKMIIYEDEDEEVNQVSLQEITDKNDNDDEEGVRQDTKPIGNVVRVSGEGESRRNHFKGFEADGVSYELVSHYHLLFA